jgi:hypothetical protein
MMFRKISPLAKYHNKITTTKKADWKNYFQAA